MKKKNLKKSLDALEKILSKPTKKEIVKFSEMVISSDAMYVVRQLMSKHSISEKEISKKLKISQKHFRDLTTGDKYITIELIAKLQEIFNIGFRIVTSDMIKKEEK